MKDSVVAQWRTIAVVGGPGSGKTSFMESVLFVTGVKTKKGSVEQKNTTSDYLVEEKSHQSSYSTSLIPVEYDSYKFNFLDTPGNRELVSDVYQALSVVKGAILVVDGPKGIDIGTEQVLSDLRERNIPTLIYVNKMDKDNIKFEELIDKLKAILGNQAVPFLYPIVDGNDFNGYVNLIDMKSKVLDGGKIVEQDIPSNLQDTVEELREQIIESVATSSEELMDKYFEGEELTYNEVCGGLRSGVLNGDLKPIIFGSSIKDIGVRDLLEMIAMFMPAPNDLKPIKGHAPKSDELFERATKDEEPFSAYVFKTTIDPFVGQMSYVKIFSGTLESGQKVMIGNTEDSLKIGNITLLRGNEQIDVEKLHAGDVGVVTKMEELTTGVTICDPKAPFVINGAPIPNPTIYVAVKPKNKKDEDKISSSLHKLSVEDPSFQYKRSRETAQLLVGGQGMQHINLVLEKLKNMFKVEVDIEDQKVVYRETIKRKADAEGRHKKQSGGSGQFGVVKMRFEPINPNDSEFEFDEEIHGGSVPKNYFPAVEKGLIETFEKGPLAGFPVIGVRAVLYDGQYHAVDSNEISFKLAARLAFKNALEQASPTLLEPIMKLEIVVKDDYVGDVMGDINKRRGQVAGMEPLEGGRQRIIAEVPESEIVSYTLDLQAMTQGTGAYQREFVRYEEVPHSMLNKLVEELNRDQEE
jgi:elongation factor G